MEETNILFAQENGVLFDAGKYTLITFPPASPISVYGIPEQTIVIGEYSFMDCINLVMIFIPETGNIQNIMFRAFYNCSNLETINLPSSITSIELDAFVGCKKIRCGQIIKLSNDVLQSALNSGLPEKATRKCACPTRRNQRFYNSYKQYSEARMLNLLAL